MKKAAVVLAAVALLSIGAVAYANRGDGYDRGYGPRGDGPMMMRDLSPEDQKLFDETADLRKEMHLKRFELREAVRKGDDKKAEAIEKEIDGLREKLSAKLGPNAERLGFGPGKGYGRDGKGYGRQGKGRGDGKGYGMGYAKRGDCDGYGRGGRDGGGWDREDYCPGPCGR